MKIRQKETERGYFSYKDKEEVLKKSDGRCCHCGCKLYVGENFTLDHFIPISKGGTNDFVNLYALCKDCNLRKENYVLSPESFYKYLKDEYLDELYDLYESYTSEYIWLTPTNFLPEDKIELEYTPKSTMYWRSETTAVNHSAIAVMRKAKYFDAPDIEKYLLKYYKKIGIVTNEFEVRNYVEEQLRNAAYYIITTANQYEITALIGIGLHEDDNTTYVSIDSAYCYYKKLHYIGLMTQAIFYLFRIIQNETPNKHLYMSLATGCMDDVTNKAVDCLSRLSYVYVEQFEVIENQNTYGISSTGFEADYEENMQVLSDFWDNVVWQYNAIKHRRR